MDAPPTPKDRGAVCGCEGREPNFCPPEPQEAEDESSSLALPFADAEGCDLPVNVLPAPENELG